MEYKMQMVERPPTPPESPELAVSDNGGFDPYQARPSPPSVLRNGHHHSPWASADLSSVASTSNLALRPSQPASLGARRNSSGAINGLGLAPGRRTSSHGALLPRRSSDASTSSSLGLNVQAAGTSTQAYPQPSNAAEKASSYTKQLSQKARLLISTASHSLTNALPAPATPPLPHSPTFGKGPLSPRERRSPTQHVNGAPPSRRALTGKAVEDTSAASPSRASRELASTLARLLPSPSTKRIRTRSRRLLIFFGCLALLCYTFSNTLREAYGSAAVAREEHIMEEEERKRLGPNLREFQRHPIDELMERAKEDWDAKVARQSTTVEEAITEYRRRYKRDPPNGYSEWFEYAKESGAVLVDEYDSLMESLEPFWALEPAELRRRTFQIGMQPSFALVHVEEGENGGTFWDANENEELIKPFGVERARGFERMVRPFVGRPGIVNMVFAINELAEPRVLVPWEEKLLIDEALKNGSTVNLEQFAAIPGRTKTFFPNPVWTGDGTTWEVFMRTCPPDGKARKVLTAMTNHVVHLADTLHVAYKGVRVPYGRKKSDKVIETVKDGKEVEVQVNPKSSRRRRKETSSPPAIDIAATELVGEGQYERRDAKTGEEDSLAEFDQASMLEKPAEEPFRRPGEGGYPTSNVFLNTPEFVFNNNVTSLSHETLCSDSSMHDTQGQFCSDFRSLESLYPVFSPSTMPGFSDVVIPSHYYASTGGKYHLGPHRKGESRAVQDPETGKWRTETFLEPLPAWETRKNQMFWRGSTTGGGNNPAGRQLMYQRHRFVRLATEDSEDPKGVLLPAANSSSELMYVELPSRVLNEQSMDVAFTSLDGCGHEKVCDAVREGKYRIGNKVPLLEIANYKMLVDIDGMAYSARFMALLESGAAVLKSTIYTEYYSDQIQPWHHFIPVSTLYSEIYNIYSYFLGSPPSSAPATKAPARQSTKKKHKKPFAQAGHTLSDHRLGGDTQADDEEDVTEPHRDFAAPANEGAHEYELRDIGARGQEWMNKFGQTKDMEIYCYRLALEWGRLWQRDGFNGTF